MSVEDEYARRSGTDTTQTFPYIVSGGKDSSQLAETRRHTNLSQLGSCLTEYKDQSSAEATTLGARQWSCCQVY